MLFYSRIRVDHGGENNLICTLMELLRGADRGSAIRGKSTNNQKIERAWVDVWNGATNIYYDIFSFLETRGSLDVENERQMWALLYVFLPRLNRELKSFQGQWNHHKIRTAGRQSPLQLFVGGCMALCNTQLTAMQDFFHPEAPEEEQEQEEQGEEGNADQAVQPGDELDWDAQGPEPVQVPDVRCPLSDEQLQLLKQEVDPLAPSDQLGMDLYISASRFIDRVLE